MTWTWFTQSTPDTATPVASASDSADLATIDAQVLAAYSPTPDVILISRINAGSRSEVVLLDRSENSSPWAYSLESAAGGWRYAVVMPNGSRYELSPEEAQPGRDYTYPISDAIYAAAYDDFKQKYKSPLIVSDGAGVYRVWLYRYDSADPAGIYPIVWASVDGGRGSLPDATTVLTRSAETSQGSGQVTGPVSGGGGPVTITSTGTRQTVDALGDAPAHSSTGSGIAKFAVAVVAVAGLAWAAGWLK